MIIVCLLVFYAVPVTSLREKVMVHKMVEKQKQKKSKSGDIITSLTKSNTRNLFNENLKKINIFIYSFLFHFQMSISQRI